LPAWRVGQRSTARLKTLDLALDHGTIDDARRTRMGRQALDERLEALEAHVVKSSQFGKRLRTVVDALVVHVIVLGGDVAL
jgi:hypothetical protein